MLKEKVKVFSHCNKADMGSALIRKGQRDSLTVCEQGGHSGFGDTNQVQPIV